MATLHVTNIPEARYRALQKLAKRNHRSVSGEVIALLEQWVPTEAELRKRRKAVYQLMKLRSKVSAGSGPYQSAEEMIREDRER
jgi:plasmid stability protein